MTEGHEALSQSSAAMVSYLRGKRGVRVGRLKAAVGVEGEMQNSPAKLRLSRSVMQLVGLMMRFLKNNFYHPHLTRRAYFRGIIYAMVQESGSCVHLYCQ